MDGAWFQRHQQHGATGAEASAICIAVVVPLRLVWRRQWIQLLAGLTPNAEPRTAATHGNVIAIDADVLLEFSDRRKLMRQVFVIAKKLIKGDRACIRHLRRFGNTSDSTCRTSWMLLLARMGLRAISSLDAATPIAIAAAV